ncbi:MAG: hypothetical protein ABL918_06410 [Chakrabartia sp.]
MRHSSKLFGFALLAATALATTIPVLGQDKPESILPPGFGDPVSSPIRKPDRMPDKGEDSVRKKPSDILPSLPLSPSVDRLTPATEASGTPVAGNNVANDSTESGDSTEEEDSASAPILVDIPAQVRRSTAVIGVLGINDGDMGEVAFQSFNGRYLTKLMRNLDAPIASRWGSILLRRALLSRSRTPADVNGADWAAERAWLLLRMGEADSARLLVQNVDVDRYTPKMFDIAMQTALATSDPAALCAMTDYAAAQGKNSAWTLARAMCSGLSGESAVASSLLDRVRDKRGQTNIDVLLAEKVVGAGTNSRRAVVVQWDGVTRLTAWRYGLATATGVEIPETLMTTVGPHVRGWQSRAPYLSLERKLPAAESSAAMGILSSAALVDFYSALMDETEVSDRSEKPFMALKTAYSGDTMTSRIAAMQALWTVKDNDPIKHYARQILTARAAAQIPPSEDYASDSAGLIGSMLSAGLDYRAGRWINVVNNADDTAAWGLLAVGNVKPLGAISESQISDFAGAFESNGTLKSQFLFAALAGLGRLEPGDVEGMAEQFEVPIGRTNSWTKALHAAANARSSATVALLCAIGMQSNNWKDIPPAHLFHIVSTLRQVGYEAEARMIAAEALMRV